MARPKAILVLALAAACAAKAPKPPAAPTVLRAPAPPDPLASAVRSPGFVTLWRKDERVWLGIERTKLDLPFLFCYDPTRGMGEHEPQLNGNNVGHCVVAAFHRNGNQLQLRALNSRYTARAGSPEARAVRESFSDSLMGAGLLVSAPSAAGLLVIDASGLLLSDIPGYGAVLEESYRQPYAFDLPSSGFGAIRAGTSEASVDVTAHFRLARPMLPPLGLTVPRPPMPSTLVDDRSFFLGLQYRFARLPPPYARRAADDRVGHFTVTRYDYSDDLHADPRVHDVTRWRLERADPDAATSRPRRPIIYYLDANIPARYRATVRDAILAWNAPFERIGFKEAIEVRDIASGANPDHLTLPYAWVRWFIQPGNASARGGIVTDPRTGEILHAHIVIPDNWMRGVRSSFLEDRVPTVGAEKGAADACAYGETAAEELAFALEVLDARGEVAPDGPEAEEIVQAVLKEVVMHEVGHTLGLTHNFRASIAYRQDQLDDPAFTRAHGIAGSVMDYNPINLGLRNKPHGDYAMIRPGPYDEWALEYAYRPFAPDEEPMALAKLAARGGEPGLAYSSDAEAGDDDFVGVDPEVNRRDLGSDQLAFARRRFALSRELWQHLAQKHVTDGDSEEVVRRAFDRAFGGAYQAARLLAKHVGGVIHLRDHAGGRAPFAPVAAARQREALALLETEVLSPDAFKFPSALLNRLAVNNLVWYGPDPTYRLHDNVVALQRSVLAHLLGSAVAGRLIEMEARAKSAPEAFHLAELYDRLRTSVWRELDSGGDIPPLRRSLQRLHVELLVRLALRTTPDIPEDARSLARANLRLLATRLRHVRPKALGPEARAHLDDSLALVDRALAASLQVAPPG